jgi:hypothetical protein
MKKHTKEPWELQDSSDDEGDTISITSTDQRGDWTVARVNLCMGEESQANARLIAAAPDLYAALVELMRYAPGKYANDTRTDSEIDLDKESAFKAAAEVLSKINQAWNIGEGDLKELGFSEGEECGRNGCTGIIAIHDVEGCSCHISAPCSACLEPRNFCPVCEWEEADD